MKKEDPGIINDPENDLADVFDNPEPWTKSETKLVAWSFFAAFVVSFIRALTTLSVIVFLSTSKNVVATFTIMNFVSDGFYGKAAALTTTLLLIAFSVLGLAKFIMGKKMDLFKI